MGYSHTSFGAAVKGIDGYNAKTQRSSKNMIFENLENW
jgi:hypothetical protein